MKYQDAEKMFKTARNGCRILQRNTKLYKLPNGNFGVRLHNTYVVEITPENHYILNTGGWYTPTTKDRINNNIPNNLYQQNSIWYVVDRINGNEIPYFDGMIIDQYGSIINTEESKDMKLVEKTKKQLDKLVR